MRIKQTFLKAARKTARLFLLIKLLAMSMRITAEGSREEKHGKRRNKRGATSGHDVQKWRRIYAD